MLARGAQTNAKEDTRILLLAGDLDDDLSQYDTDLTAASAGGYEDNSARCAITTTREVYVRVTAVNGESSRVYIAHGNHGGTDRTFAITTNGGGNLALLQNAATLWTDAAKVPSADISIAWSMRDNPDTTGAGDAKISEIIVYNHDTSAWLTIEQFTHVAPTTSSTWTLSVNGRWNGAVFTVQPNNDPVAARVSSSFHSSTEFAEDWVAARTAYAGAVADEIVEPLGPTRASGLGSSPEIVGRAQVGYAAAHSRAVQRRGWSSLANEAYVDPATGSSTGTSTWPLHWLRVAPGSASYKMPLAFLRWVGLPAGATHAWIRVHVRSWVTGGAAVPLGIRCYALNKPPDVLAIGAGPAPALEYAWRGEVITIDHTSTGTGEWLELGLLRLPRFVGTGKGWRDTVHLALAFAIDPAAASANDAAERFQIAAWHARPVYLTTPGGYA